MYIRKLDCKNCLNISDILPSPGRYGLWLTFFPGLVRVIYHQTQCIDSPKFAALSQWLWHKQKEEPTYKESLRRQMDEVDTQTKVEQGEKDLEILIPGK